MKTYIALLRGINVSGQKMIKMNELKNLCEDLGFLSISTYIQTGNIIFKSAKEETVDVLEGIIKKGIQDRFGFDVPVMVLTADGLLTIHENNPYLNRKDIDQTKLHYTILSKEPNSESIEALNSYSSDTEGYESLYKTIYLYLPNGYGRTKLNVAFFEKKLKCKATNRNINTIIKLLELSKL